MVSSTDSKPEVVGSAIPAIIPPPTEDFIETGYNPHGVRVITPTAPKPKGADDKSTSEPKAQKTLLGTGLKIFGGVLKEEKLGDLASFSKRMLIYTEMSHDHVVATLTEAIMAPMLSAEFSVDDPTDTPEGIKRAEFIEANIEGLADGDWRQHVEEALDFIGYGFSISEVILVKRKDGHLYVDSLIPVGQDTILGWGTMDNRGRPDAVYQQSPLGGDKYSAPMDKLVHMTYRPRKRNPEGTGIYRSLYRPWYFRKNFEVLEAIGAERDIGNMPVAELDPKATLSAEAIDDLGEKLGKMRIDETAWAIMPPGVKLQAFGSGGKVYDFREIIRDWSHNMYRRFFADFLSTGAENVGNSATAKELTGFFAMAIRYIQKRMLDSWNTQLVPYLLRFNPSFGADLEDLASLPKIRWERVGRENIQALATTLSTLIDSGILSPDDDLEDRVRESLELPKRTVDREPEERLVLTQGTRTDRGAPVGEDKNTPNTNPVPKGGKGNKPRAGARGAVEEA